MILADVTFSTEGIAVISVLLVALSGTVTYLFRQLLSELREQRDSYKKLAVSATVVLEEAAVRHQKQHGIQPIPLIPPVVPQHNSPTSPKQREAADFATLQARTVAATVAIQLKPPEPPPAGSEEAKVVEIQTKAQEIKDTAEELIPNHRGDVSPADAVDDKVNEVLGRTSPDATNPRRTPPAPPDKTGEP
jgi:hypothetical protein